MGAAATPMRTMSPAIVAPTPTGTTTEIGAAHGPSPVQAMVPGSRAAATAGPLDIPMPSHAVG